MLLIYTGEGKGKTSAAVGQAVRGLGQNMRVAFCQFMKRPGQAGEQEVLQRLLKDDFFAGGKGFLRPGQDRQAHAEAARATLAWARKRLEQGATMLVLDEALYALGAGLLLRGELEKLIHDCASQDAHLVLTGRGLPQWLEDTADLVTEMHPVKHPFERGVTAQPGIEY